MNIFRIFLHWHLIFPHFCNVLVIGFYPVVFPCVELPQSSRGLRNFCRIFFHGVVFVGKWQKKFKKLSDNIFTNERCNDGLVVLGFAKFWWQYKVLKFYKSKAVRKWDNRSGDQHESLFSNNPHLLIICCLLV